MLLQKILDLGLRPLLVFQQDNAAERSAIHLSLSLSHAHIHLCSVCKHLNLTFAVDSVSGFSPEGLRWIMEMLNVSEICLV